MESPKKTTRCSPCRGGARAALAAAKRDRRPKSEAMKSRHSLASSPVNRLQPDGQTGKRHAAGAGAYWPGKSICGGAGVVAGAGEAAGEAGAAGAWAGEGAEVDAHSSTSAAA